jgi:hypothetical protein
MANTPILNRMNPGEAGKKPKAGPSGATDETREREKKFDEEGGAQPQAPSQHAVDEELQRARRKESPRTR